MKFWHHPLGKIMSHVVHDFNGASCSLDSSLMLLEKEVTSGKVTNEYILERIKKIRSATKRQQDAIDYAWNYVFKYVENDEKTKINF